MKKLSTLTLPILLLITLFLVPGCMTISNFVVPDALEPGDIQVGAGTMATVDEESGLWVLPEIGGRFGVVKNIDIGMKYTMLNVLATDVKYQFIKQKINAAVDIETSICKGGDGNYYYGINPMVVLGQKHWHVGVKGRIQKEPSNEFYYNSTQFVAGVRIGKEKLNLLIELNAYINDFYNLIDNENFLIPSIGLYYKFNLKSHNRNEPPE